MRGIMVAAAAFAVIALLIGIVLPVPVENPARSLALGSWSTPVQVSGTEMVLTDSCQQTLYAHGETELIFSPDDGATWNAPVVSEGAIDVEDHVLYRVNFSDELSSMDLFFSKSADNGTTWTDSSFVIEATGGSDGAYRIFKFGSVLIFYTYVHAGLGIGHINYTRSTDGGATWSDQAYIDDYVHVEDPEAADIVLCQGKLFLAYYHYDTDPVEFHHVVVIESDDMGATWTNRQVVGDGFLPQMKTDSGNLYVTYWGFDGLMFTMSDDSGASWSTPLMVGAIQGYTDPSNVHALAVSGSSLFAAYMDYDNGGDPEYLMHINYSADGGSSWDDLGDVIGLDTNAIYPSLLVSGGKLHFMFIDAGPSANWGGPTYYRWLWLDFPIPEFGIVVIPILGTVVLVVLLPRRR